MTSQVVSKPTQKKGERTKRRILDGALQVLAEKGVEGTTHRAVAKAAGVSLSTTTYHFSSLSDLLVQGFDRCITDRNDVLVTALDTFVHTILDAGLTPDSDQSLRRRLRDELAQVMVGYLYDPAPERQVMLAAEMRFFYEASHIGELQQRLDAYRAGIVNQLKVLPQRAGSPDPVLDAEILFDAIQSLQFRALSRPGEATREALINRANRYLGWLLNC